jgi:hypothetical protein
LGAEASPTHRSYLGAIDLRSGRVTPWSPQPNCAVSALAISRGTLHVGGCFDQIAGRTSGDGLAAFALRSGALSPRFPGLQHPARVEALAADGRGGIWIGGALGALEPTGYQRGLVHLDVNGQPAAHVPDVAGDVRSLAVRDGVLYLGGGFVSVGGQARAGLASIRVSSGAVTGFDPEPAGGGASALVALRGGGLLAGGPFSGMELRATSGLARFR